VKEKKILEKKTTRTKTIIRAVGNISLKYEILECFRKKKKKIVSFLEKLPPFSLDAQRFLFGTITN